MDTKHGTHNEGLEERTGYCQAVSGLCEMTEEHDRMLTAEGRYWRKFKIRNHELWEAQLKRLKQTRGTIFTERLLKCIKWLERKRSTGSEKGFQKNRTNYYPIQSGGANREKLTKLKPKKVYFDLPKQPKTLVAIEFGLFGQFSYFS